MLCKALEWLAAKSASQGGLNGQNELIDPTRALSHPSWDRPKCHCTRLALANFGASRLRFRINSKTWGVSRHKTRENAAGRWARLVSVAAFGYSKAGIGPYRSQAGCFLQAACLGLGWLRPLAAWATICFDECPKLPGPARLEQNGLIRGRVLEAKRLCV